MAESSETGTQENLGLRDKD